MNLFGVPVTVIGEETLLDEQDIEDKDNEVYITNEEMYVTSEGEEWGSNGFFAPPKQRWWMR